MRIPNLLALIVLVALAVWLVSAIKRAREAARESTCQGRMNQLQLALQSYENANGHLPPAYVAGPDGKPWHSWRVLLLPYMEKDEVYKRYRFDEPWNGPNNRMLADQIHVEMFQCPSGRDLGRTRNTNYVVVGGDGTAFPGDGSTSFKEFRDGTENTVLLVEIADSDIHWMEPRDLPLESLAWEAANPAKPVLSNIHAIGAGVVFADRISCFRAPRELRMETLRGLFTIAGGEPATRDSLTRGESPKILVEQ